MKTRMIPALGRVALLIAFSLLLHLSGGVHAQEGGARLSGATSAADAPPSR